jgi:hypothetical protein
MGPPLHTLTSRNAAVALIRLSRCFISLRIRSSSDSTLPAPAPATAEASGAGDAGACPAGAQRGSKHLADVTSFKASFQAVMNTGPGRRGEHHGMDA